MSLGLEGSRQAFGNCSKKTIKKMRELWEGVNYWNLDLEGSRPALGNRVKETTNKIREFWEGVN